ncbi:MAG: hypothetical protein JWQ06_1418 [Mucilaginibacter sp.]|nr:hypothetical protein [Mucilaginibacter sp.]
MLLFNFAIAKFNHCKAKNHKAAQIYFKCSCQNKWNILDITYRI